MPALTNLSAFNNLSETCLRWTRFGQVAGTSPDTSADTSADTLEESVSRNSCIETFETACASPASRLAREASSSESRTPEALKRKPLIPLAASPACPVQLLLAVR